MCSLLTPGDIDRQSFVVHGLFGGYDIAEVDEFLEQVKHTIEVLAPLAQKEWERENGCKNA